MAMTSARLKPLRQLADLHEQDALRQLAQRQAQLATQEARLQELRNYLDDYLRAPPPGSAQLLGNHHAFVARLREAESFQQRAVEQARSACDTQRAHWLAGHRDVGVIDLLARSYRVQEQRRQEQRVQSQMDDFAALRCRADPLGVML